MKKLLLSLIILGYSLPALAGGWLKQGTATTVNVGPFVVIADGSLQSSATITGISLSLIKHYDTMASTVTTVSAAVSGSDNDCVFVAKGMYNCELSAANIDTVGRFDVIATYAATYPTFNSYMVVAADAWNRDIAGDIATIEDVRVEMDNSSTKLANLDTNVGSRQVSTTLLTIPQDVDYNNFTFRMFSTSGAVLTGLTVTCQVSKDGAALASCANSVSEVGGGLYKVNLSGASDLNVENESYFVFTATGARPMEFKINVQR